MAVLTKDKSRAVRLVNGPLHTMELPLAGYTNFGGGSEEHTVYKGSGVICDVSDTDGYFRACPLGSSVNSAAGDIFGGIAIEQAKVKAANTGDGDVKVTVARDGVFAFAKGSLAQTDIGAPVYLSDDDTLSTTSSNNYWCGILEEVDAVYAWVNIAPAFMRLNSAT